MPQRMVDTLDRHAAEDALVFRVSALSALSRRPCVLPALPPMTVLVKRTVLSSRVSPTLHLTGGEGALLCSGFASLRWARW